MALPAVFLFLLIAALTPPVFAQEQVPQIAVGERKATKKKDIGPRAVAVLQLKDNNKATLIPIAILIDGKFWDASAYKADPIPMALDTGTVYEAERTGNSLGLFTVGRALHSLAANAPNPWLGTGTWLPGGADNTKVPLKAETVPVGIDTSDQPPRLTKNPQPAAPAATAPSSTPPPPPPQSSDPDAPPRLIKPTSSTPPDSTPAQSGSTQSAPSSTTSPSTKPGDTKSPDTKASDSKSSDTKSSDAKPDRSQQPASDSGINESTRPKLRRGQVAVEPPDEDIPGYAKPGKLHGAAPRTANAADVRSDQGPVQSIPAISDASSQQPRSFTFEWLKDEEGDRHKQMADLAKDQVRAYLDARAKARTALAGTPKPAAASAARRAPVKKGPDPILENVQMIAYDLWNSNQPIIVFSADAHMPPPPAGAAHSETESEMHYAVMLVAYPDIYNNLHKLYVGVTDKFHLDLTPRLDLIDALDADGDGRGELLFKETSDAGSGWIIYRATGDKLWKMFDSLNPE